MKLTQEDRTQIPSFNQVVNAVTSVRRKQSALAGAKRKPVKFPLPALSTEEAGMTDFTPLTQNEIEQAELAEAPIARWVIAVDDALALLLIAVVLFAAALFYN